MNHSTLTAIERECIAYANGSPIAPILAELAELETCREAMSSADFAIDEAMAQFPDEDFADDVIGSLIALSKHLRGENRAELLKIMGELQNLADQVALSAEYGIDELRKASVNLAAP